MKTIAQYINEKLKVNKDYNVIGILPFAKISETIKSFCKSIINDDKLYNKYRYDGKRFIDDYLDISEFEILGEDAFKKIKEALTNIIEAYLFIYRIDFIGSTEDYVLKVINNRFVLYIKGDTYIIPKGYDYFLPGYEYFKHLKYGYDSTDLVTHFDFNRDLPGFIFAKTKERLITLIEQLHADPYFINYNGSFDEDDIVFIKDYNNDDPYYYSSDRYTDVRSTIDDYKSILKESIELYNSCIEELTNITEKLKVTKDYQELTVESLIDALYNYGPTLVLKDVFGRKQIKLEPSEYLSKDEEGYAGSRILEIYFSTPETFRNIPGQVTFFGIHKTSGLDIFVVCEVGEDEKLYSLFKPGVLETIYKYLIEHKR